MTIPDLVPQEIRARFDVRERRNGLAVLHTAHRDAWQDIVTVLKEFKLPASEIVAAGGSKSLIAKRVDAKLYSLGWKEKKYVTATIVDDVKYDAPTHRVDCVK